MKKLLPKYQKSGLIKLALKSIKTLSQPKATIVEINGVSRTIPDRIMVRKIDYLPGSDIDESAKLLGFEPLYVLGAIPGNTEFSKEVTIPRFIKYAELDNPENYDVTKSMPWFDATRRRIITMPPTMEIEDIATRPSYLGYYTDPEKDKTIMGQFDTKHALSYVNHKALNIPSVVLHERNMHGTDHIIDALAPKAVNEYTQFVNNIFKNITPIEGKIKLSETAAEIKDIPGSRNWYEARATIGELVRQLFYKVAKENGYKGISGHVKELTPKFEKYVDDLENSKLNFLLSGINGYGQIYSLIGPKVNPNFYTELKSLIKYTPSLLLFNDYSDNE